jgi:hypothetical protein
MHNNLIRKHEGKIPLGEPKRRLEDNIKRILKKYDIRMWNGSTWLRTGSCGEFCERDNEPSGFLKDVKFIN